MRDLLEFLKEITRIIPPDVGSHAMFLSPEGILIAQIRHHRMRQKFYFGSSDFDRSPSELAAEIAEIVERNFSTTAPSCEAQ